MRMRARMAGTLAALVLLAGCGGADDAERSNTTGTAGSATPARTPTTTTLHLDPLVSGLDAPVQVIVLPDSADHLWVLERSGLILDVHGGRVSSSPVADLRDSTQSGGERGLLSLALHPNFPATDLAYIHRSDPNGNTLVTEHRVDAGHISAEPVRVLLRVAQPFSNHNGGSLAFGPDGLLYLGLGDGGAGGDPNGNGQRLDTRLGKLLRVDVAGPIDWQIAAYGLRNPWRFSFDPQTGDGWIGDVGQRTWEEVDRFPRGAPQLNYGWSVREGRHAYPDGGNRSLAGPGRVTEPVAEYSHDHGCSITGGVVVRDRELGRLAGRYIYADYCSGRFWSLPTSGGGTPRIEPITANAPVSIDAGPDHHVYVTSLAGEVLRLSRR